MTLDLAMGFIYDTKSISRERKIDKLDAIKMKNFCAKDTIKKIKGQPTDEEKKLQIIFDKSLVSRVY